MTPQRTRSPTPGDRLKRDRRMEPTKEPGIARVGAKYLAKFDLQHVATKACSIQPDFTDFAGRRLTPFASHLFIPDHRAPASTETAVSSPGFTLRHSVVAHRSPFRRCRQILRFFVSDQIFRAVNFIIYLFAACTWAAAFRGPRSAAMRVHPISQGAAQPRCTDANDPMIKGPCRKSVV